MWLWNAGSQGRAHLQTVEGRHLLRSPGELTLGAALPTRRWIQARQSAGKFNRQNSIVSESHVPMHRDSVVSGGRAWKRASHVLRTVLGQRRASHDRNRRPSQAEGTSLRWFRRHTSLHAYGHRVRRT